MQIKSRLSLLAGLVFFGTAVHAQTFSVGSDSGEPGDTVTVNVGFEQGANGAPAAGIGFDIAFNDTVLLNPNVTNCLANVGSTSASISSCLVISPGNVIRVTLLRFGGPLATSNPLGTLSFQIAGGATAPSSTPLTGSISDCTDALGAAISCTPVSGQITITAPVVAQPDGSITPASRNFGNVSVGTTSPAQAFTVNSTGAANLQISSIGLSGGSFAQTNNCPSGAPGLPSGQSCTINVTCTPLSAVPVNETLTVATNAGNRTANVSCTGVTPPPPAPVFGSNVPPGGLIGVVPNAAPFNLIVSNAGTATLNVTSGLTGPTGAFTVNPTSLNVPASGSQGISISCSVEGATGALTLTTNDPNRPNVTYNLSCQNPVAMATPIPTLSTWGLIILSGLLGLLAFRQRKGGMRFSA